MHKQAGLLTAAYTELTGKHPKCRAHRRIFLDVLPATSPLFCHKLEAYIR